MSETFKLRLYDLFNLPDGFRGDDDSINDVVPDSLLILLMEAEGHWVCHVGCLTLLPELGNHVLQIYDALRRQERVHSVSQA